jgi:CRISPR-associated endonuclease Cas1
MSHTLYIDRHGTRVGVCDGRIVLHLADGSESDYPARQIDQVVVLGHAHFSHDAIACVLREQIPVVFSSLRGGYRGTLGGRPGRQIHLRQAQMDAMRDPRQRLAVARALVVAKLRGHGRLLRQWGAGGCADIAAGLGSARHCPAPENMRGIEGAAARAFFAGLRRHLARSGFQFGGRIAHPPPDPVNAVLSLVYTLLLNEVEVGVAAAGLDAAGGFYHVAGDGRPTLLMDLVEPLRPLADRLSAHLLRHLLQPGDFIVEEGACHVQDGRRGVIYKAWEELLCSHVRWRGENTGWRRLIHAQAGLLARWLEGRESRLAFWHLDAP